MKYSAEELQFIKDNFASGQHQKAIDFIDSKYRYEDQIAAIDADETFKFALVCDALIAASLYSIIFSSQDILITSDTISNILDASFVVIINTLISLGVVFLISHMFHPIWEKMFEVMTEKYGKFQDRKLIKKSIIASIVSIIVTVSVLLGL